jgi:hypothetical protein
MPIFPRVPYKVTNLDNQVANYRDWFKHKDGLISNVEISSIDDDSDNSDAMASSIPNPLARIYLFKSAFEYYQKQLQDNFDEYRRKGFTGPFAYLVSDCLDFLQFLYENPTDIIIKNWDINDEIDKLDRLGNIEQQRFAKTLSTFLNVPEFETLGTIQLIFYKYKIDDNVEELLIGGTSPFTLVYTTANWNRIYAEKALNITSKMPTSDGRNDTFFDNDIKPLEVRTEFCKFLFSFLHGSTSGFNSSIKNYIAQVKDRFFNGHNVEALAENGFTNISFGEINLDIDGRTYKASNEGAYESDFFINGSSTPRNSDFSNEKRPIVIRGGMPLNGRKYFGTATWSESISVPVIPSNQRRIPGSTIQYPYLTTDDFFEDKLIELDSAIDNEKFYSYTATGNDRIFLLPLKSLFFEFFSSHSISDKLEYSVYQKPNNTSVDIHKFSLKIPVSNRDNSKSDFVTLIKEYSDVEILNFRDTRFRFALTPGYIVNIEGVPNTYNAIAVYEKSDTNNYNIELNFFKNDSNDYDEATTSSPNFKVKKSLVSNEENPGLDIERRNNTKVFFSNRIVQPAKQDEQNKLETLSNHYYIKSTFDYLSIDINKNGKQFSGIVCPKFVPYDQHENTHAITVAIDFGTSNTFVAIKKGNEVKPLELGEGKKLVSFLTDNFNKDIIFKKAIKNEFMPQMIAENDSDHYVSFPNRTVMYECTNSKNLSTSLFLKSNVGFFFESEETDDKRKGVKSITNLKPKFDANPDSYEKFVTNYIKQLLLIIKYKVLLENGSFAGLTIKYTYPHTGNDEYVSKINSILNLMSKEVFGTRTNNEGKEINLVQIERVNHAMSESQAPLYFIKHKEGRIFDSGNVINIDIGGGTTDFVFYLKDNNNGISKSRISSVKFAGNDLWGYYDEKEKGPNGFLKAWEKLYMQNSEVNNTNAFKRYIKLKESGVADASDLTNLLFRYDADLKFSGIFENKDKKYNLLKFPLFLHFSTIIYYTLLNLKKIKESGVDYDKINCLSFTGKGSSYLKILFKKVDPLSGKVGVDKDKLKSFIAEMVKNFNSLKSTTISINTQLENLINIVENPKQATALGALYCDNIMDIAHDNNYENILSMPSEGNNDEGVDVDEDFNDAPNSVTSDNSTYTEENLKSDNLTEHKNFVKLMFGKDYIKNYDFSFIDSERQNIINLINLYFKSTDGLLSSYSSWLSSSYTEYLSYLKNNNASINQKESRFFIPYKSLLFKLSNELFKDLEENKIQ